MAKKIHHQGILFPTPTKSLLDGMALAGYMAFTNSIDLEMDTKLSDWDNTNEFVRIAWLDSSRAMYAFLAVAAGAPLTEVPPVTDEE